MRKQTAFSLFSALTLWMLGSSCGSVKHNELLLLQGLSLEQMGLDKVPVLTIQPDDILNIQVTSRNPQNVIAFHIVRESTAATSNAALGTPEGYRVDENGDIFLPYLGRVQAAGSTLQQLRSQIDAELAEFIQDASVQVRFVNFRVTLMGEVRAPNTYVIPNERLTILEAIGMAGDFTEYARRNNVLIIRERSEVREFARVNTQDPTLFRSPYFYLSPNDIVYIEPLKARQYATRGDLVERYSIIAAPLISGMTFWLLGWLTRNN